MDAGDDGVEHQGAACAAGGMLWEMACGNGLWKCKPNGINDDQTGRYGLAPELRLISGTPIPTNSLIRNEKVGCSIHLSGPNFRHLWLALIVVLY